MSSRTRWQLKLPFLLKLFDTKGAEDIMEAKLIGRKLYIRWFDNGYVAVEKIPAGSKKLAEMAVADSDLQLCNVLEDADGNKVEEILGAPAFNQSGYTIDVFFRDSRFWKTPGEYADPNREDV